MYKSITYPYFSVENSTIISGEDLKNLRKFYAPILGAHAILLYEYLRDLAIQDGNEIGFYDYDSITYMLKMDIKDVNNARTMLEALSLLTTYVDNRNRKTFFVIEKPLDADGFKMNLILANKLLKIVGKENYDRLINRKRNYKLARAIELLDSSARYEDVFDAGEDFDILSNSFEFNEEAMNTQVMNELVQEKIDLNTFEYPNVYEAILKTDSRSFFGQIQGQIPTAEIINLIKDASDKGFSYQCINLIFFYANEVNGKINYQYVKKIIKDLIAKNIYDFNPLEKYIDSLIRQRNNVIVSKKDLYKATYITSLERQQNDMNRSH